MLYSRTHYGNSGRQRVNKGMNSRRGGSYRVDGKTLLSLRVPRDIRAALIVTHVIVLAFLYVFIWQLAASQLLAHIKLHCRIVAYRVVQSCSL